MRWDTVSCDALLLRLKVVSLASSLDLSQVLIDRFVRRGDF